MNQDSFTSLHHLFRNAAYNIHQPDYDWLFRKVDGVYKPITYKQCEVMINAVSANMVEAGFERGDKVAFISENCPEYLIFDQGLQQIGLVNASIYPTLSESEIEFI
ncbi:MAG: AMP-binding protein, partial [Bacteroidetes bacterium]|nr:AMP-binding protein [Bacteroidota bacterium]